MNYEAISIKYYGCVSVFLLLLLAMHIVSFLCHIRVLFVACLALPYFPYLINGTIFRKKLLNTKLVFWFSLQLWNIFAFQEEFSEILSQIYIIDHVKYPLVLQDFNQTWNLSTDFQKNPQTSNFMKICPMGAKSFHTDVQMDSWEDRHNKANSCFSQFCKHTCLWNSLVQSIVQDQFQHTRLSSWALCK
jgi:hypothetical protein